MPIRQRQPPHRPPTRPPAIRGKPKPSLVAVGVAVAADAAAMLRLPRRPNLLLATQPIATRPMATRPMATHQNRSRQSVRPKPVVPPPTTTSLRSTRSMKRTAMRLRPCALGTRTTILFNQKGQSATTSTWTSMRLSPTGLSRTTLHRGEPFAPLEPVGRNRQKAAPTRPTRPRSPASPSLSNRQTGRAARAKTTNPTNALVAVAAVAAADVAVNN